MGESLIEEMDESGSNADMVNFMMTVMRRMVQEKGVANRLKNELKLVV